MEHQGEITSLAWSPDGLVIVAASRDGTIRLWDANGGFQVGSVLSGHYGEVWSVAFNPKDSNVLVSCGKDMSVRIWDISRACCLGNLRNRHTRKVNSVTFSVDGKVVATGSDDSSICLWSADTGLLMGEPLTGHEEEVTSSGWPGSLVWSPTASLLASGSDNNDIKIWTVEGEVKANLKGHRMAVTSVAFNPLDENILASSSVDKTLRLWDIASASQVGEAMEGHEGWVLALAFRPSDAATLVSGGSDKALRVWNVADRKEVGKLEGHKDRVISIVFSPTDPNIAASSSADRTIRLWNTSTMEAVGKPLEGHKAFINDVQFALDGETIVASSRDHAILRWSCKTGELVNCLLRGSIVQVVKTVTSTSKIITCRSNVMYVYDMLDAEAGRCRACFKASSNIVAIDVSPPFICLGGAQGEVYQLRCDYLVR
ncbi:hypothetical protein GUITHDRAFT_65478 [Guillardia theta CCMP2712]|uniref:Uncharacterized protein n=1 Tax=Guillardia theta (strain CCMP2712) TaxID=905079 RepID=L1JVD2_GUITC|nr:hypothetical protein GUITHDRAFT_65478 [Guillardia theta CCMP2712]EKX52264.1 hypothetical protein GUITHDRAFT_65478 [Guillardia theta CCMP2712]|eukprot:XP_005839244.1 hypothetical protein GUITHDRAFT_65478 [Guillardia theta CCMP2712]